MGDVDGRSDHFGDVCLSSVIIPFNALRTLISDLQILVNGLGNTLKYCS